MKFLIRLLISLTFALSAPPLLALRLSRQTR